MLCDTPLTWYFFDFSNRLADFGVFFLYMLIFSSKYLTLVFCNISLIANPDKDRKTRCRVYMYLRRSTFCIRNASAALVMNVW